MEETQSSPLKQRYLEPDEQEEEFKGPQPLRKARGSLSKARSPSPPKLHNPNTLVDKRHATIARNQALAKLEKLNKSYQRMSSPDSNSPALPMKTRKQRKNNPSEFDLK